MVSNYLNDINFQKNSSNYNVVINKKCLNLINYVWCILVVSSVMVRIIFILKYNLSLSYWICFFVPRHIDSIYVMHGMEKIILKQYVKGWAWYTRESSKFD